jgi:putative peptide zinc metalloprotease protein
MYEITYNPQFIPQRSPKVNIKTLVVDGKKTYLMKNHLTGMYYDVDDVSYEIWNLINGQRTITEISKEMLKKWPDIESGTATDVILFLAEAGCLRAAVEQAPKKRIKVPSAFEIDVVLIENSKAFLTSIHRAFRFLFKTPLFWASAAFIIFSSIMFAGQFAVIFADADSFRILGSTVVGFFFYSFIVLGPSVAIHEMAHGLALIHYGGSPGEIGTGLFYFSPMFYIDATDAWTLSRRQRLMVMMAGNISTLLIASIIVAIGFVFPYPASISHLLYMTAFFCFYATLMNMAPPFETDGYYVLADLVNVPNLRQKSYGYVKSLFKKALGMHVNEEDLAVTKNKTLVGFAVLSVVWVVYTAFQTTLFTYYMLGDATVSFFNVYSAITSSIAVSLAAVVVSVASVLYFGMTLTGYGVILISAIKKALRAPLNFQAIHDRDLSMFFYVPFKTSSIRKNFENRMKKISGKITQNYRISQVESVFTATLRIGGTKLALNQIGIHLRNIEQSFTSVFRNFLQKNRKSILKPADSDTSTKVELAVLLMKMGNEVAEAGIAEAHTRIKEIIEEQNKNAMYLLNSAYGSVWTIELPPLLLQEVEETLLPTFLVEDCAITDLYGETEEFKKRTIYGYDSISRLAAQNRAYLGKAVKNPEEYQLISCFEPIKSRLLFVGRAERIEKDIPMFSILLIGQVWCGYLDNLLSESNLTLSTLRRPPILNIEDLKAMKDGELCVLSDNLSKLSSCEKTVRKALDECEQFTEQVKDNAGTFKKYFEENEPFKIGGLDALFAINQENLRKLPGRLKKFREEFQRIIASVDEVAKSVQKEYSKREGTVKRKLRRILYVYPLIAILSVMLILASLYINAGSMKILFLTLGASMQVLYWVIYYSRRRSLHMAGRYPSGFFVNQQLFALAFAQAIYRFMASYNVVTPIGKADLKIEYEKPKRIKKD